MLRWLGSAPEDTHNDLSSLRHEGTGDWLLRSEQFNRWRFNPGPAFLWLEGIRKLSASLHPPIYTDTLELVPANQFSCAFNSSSVVAQYKGH